jgi:hypothetical protein
MVEGDQAMTRRMKLPREGLVQPEERGVDERAVDEDVQGHGMPIIPPPGLGPNRTPGHGGELRGPIREDDEDDVEGHRINW